ncbi:MAG: type I glyceraldehyde-3-phosphate dehydrogenase [Candidatus Andersenbacteria bacterium]|nr:type I glyceraldehyde-3-phosphate dehydrogenase [Candidatus Andersenbacteria bacterium]
MPGDAKVRLAINGFGRIGRAAFKIALNNSDVEVVAINDVGDIGSLAYLLRYDTIYGRFGQPVTVEEDVLVVGEARVAVRQEKEPAMLPWGELKVDVVIESTGVFTEEVEARPHLAAGARRVIISAPSASESVATVVMGVNEADLAGQEIVSCASCTTNSVAPVVAVLDKAFGITKALLTTVHAYTASQGIVDSPARGSNARLGRAAAVNIVPEETGAARAAAKAYTPLAGAFDGVALRVPVAVVSISDITVVMRRKVTVQQVNAALEAGARDEALAGVLGVTRDAVVSSDFIGDPRSAIVDLGLTRVVGGDLVKVMAWYDNEWGYSNRLVEQAIVLGRQ